MNKIKNEVESVYKEIFNSDPLIVKSPGRINLIGEHTDYNDGYVLPAAINKSVYIAIQKRDDLKTHFFSTEFNEHYESDVERLVRAKKQWPNYIIGVVWQLLQRRYQITGFNLVVGGDIPIGSGLGSSAALTCATVFGLNEIFQLDLDKIEMIRIAQRAEHDFIGVKCGIMDQFASMFGKKNRVIRLDCRSLEFEYFSLGMEQLKIVLLDTTIKHSLASSEYNLRREQCGEGIACIQQKYPDVKNLRDVTLLMLDDCLEKDSVIYNRCKYVVSENQRVLETCEDLSGKNGRMTSAGKRMFTTHEGLSKLYQVSCKELDFLVDSVKKEKSVLGARMMGGGFGGCTINLVKEDEIPALYAKISKAYAATFGLELKYYLIETDDGTCKLN